MFDFVRHHKRVMQLILVLLIFPSFVFFGIQGYSRFGEGGDNRVARVDGQPITQAEWDAAHRNQVERARRQMPGIDSKFFDSPEVKRETLDGLVRERVLFAAARKQNLSTSDARLQHQFLTDARFAQIRNPDGTVNKDLLLAQGLSSEQFAQQLRQELTLQQVIGGVAGSVVAPAAVADAALDAFFQQREAQVLRLQTKDYLGKVQPSDTQIDAFYKDPAHATELTAPESAEIEYVVLDLDAVKKGIKVTDEDLRKYYDENVARFTAAQERRASHILVKADKSSASAADREKARQKAQSLLEQVRKAPQTFAEVARKNSDDPGSAAQGGDLDFFVRGAMVKPFEDAVFALKPGEISNVVETDFGYHIIRLDAVRGGETKNFDAVRTQVADEVGKQLAQRKFAESAELFSNTVYEQSDSLRPAAEKLQLEVRKAQVQRQPAPQASGVLASPKLLGAVFAADSLTNKRNTEAVETGPSQLASARIVSYAPARVRPLDEVRSQIRDRLAQQQAADLARREGEVRLAESKTAANPSLPAAQPISRAARADMPPPVVDAVLAADASKLPVWVGVPLGADGYAVVRVNKVLGRDAAAGDAKQMHAQYARVWAGAEADAYYTALKERFKVEITAPTVVSVPAR
jgi:peptidyl-prolyl cis-trans isomerase D